MMSKIIGCVLPDYNITLFSFSGQIRYFEIRTSELIISSSVSDSLVSSIWLKLWSPNLFQ